MLLGATAAAPVRGPGGRAAARTRGPAATLGAVSVRSVLARPVPAAAATAAAVLPLTLLVVLMWTLRAPAPIDYQWFGPGGDALLTARWGDVYRDPAVQAGAFELLPYGVAHLLGASGPVAWTVLLGGFATAGAFLIALVLRPVPGTDLRSSVLAALATAALGLAGTTETWLLGHPSEMLVPLVWVTAGRLALRDRPALAAALVALSSGFEVWGVLAAPVVLLAARPRLLRSAVSGIAVLAVLWLPFVLAGPFRMFSFAWAVAPQSLVASLAPGMTSFPWSLRLLQSLLAIGAGTAVALLVRRRTSEWGPWLVVVAVVSGRLVLDPMTASYYGIPALIGAGGALVLAAHRADLAALALSAAGLVLATDVGTPWVRAAALLAITLLAAGGERWRQRRPVPPRRLGLRAGRIGLI